MNFSLTKRFTLVLILCLGITQLLLPFIHAHYDGNIVHAESGAPLLHVHAIEIDSVATTLSLGNTHTQLVAGHVDSAVNIDEVVPNQRHFDAANFVAIFFALIVLRATFIWSYSPVLLAFKDKHSHQRPLSHAPPSF